MADVTSQGVLSAVARKSVAAAAAGIVIEEYAVAGSTSSVNSASVTLPTTINSGDLLVMQFYGQGTGTVTTPAGWTNEGGRITDGSGIGYIFWKEASGSEGSSVTVSKSSYAPWSSSVARITGADNANPFDVATTTNAGASSTQNLPAITSVTDNCLILRASGVYSTDSVGTAPSGYTNGGLSTAGTPRTVFTSKILETAGTEAVYNFGYGGYNSFVNFSMAIKPDPVYLVEEGFEGTGIPSGWSTFSGTPDYDNTTSPPEGLKALMCDEKSDQARVDFTGGTDIWAYCIYRKNIQKVHPVVTQFMLRDSSGTELCGLQTYNDEIFLYAGGSKTSRSLWRTGWENVDVHVWLHYVSSGTCELYVSSDGVKPTSDSTSATYLTKTGSAGTASKLSCEGSQTGTSAYKDWYDRVLVLDSEIGDNP